MCMLPLLQRIYLHGRSRTGRRHFSFQPLSLLRKALSTLLSGCRKLGQLLAKKQYAGPHDTADILKVVGSEVKVTDNFSGRSQTDWLVAIRRPFGLWRKNIRKPRIITYCELALIIWYVLIFCCFNKKKFSFISVSCSASFQVHALWEMNDVNAENGHINEHCGDWSAVSNVTVA